MELLVFILKIVLTVYGVLLIIISIVMSVSVLFIPFIKDEGEDSFIGLEEYKEKASLKEVLIFSILSLFLLAFSVLIFIGVYNIWFWGGLSSFFIYHWFQLNFDYI